MNKEKFGWGVALFFVGGILLLVNLDIIDFYWRSVIEMWPIVLIIIGANLLIPKRGIGPVISVLVTIAALAFLAYRGSIPPHNGWRAFGGQNDPRPAKSSRLETSRGEFTHDYDSAFKEAYLQIEGGAVSYTIAGTTDKLFSGEAVSTFGLHHLETTTTDHVPRLKFSMKNKRKGNWDLDADENRATIRLNPNPSWHIDLDMGAGKADFDLTEYNVASLSFEGGAASFKAKMGMPLQETVITAESGMANVEIEIPEEAACRIVIDSGLSSKDFPGFVKQDDGSYVTENYSETRNRFVIDLEGGLTAFSVRRYR